MSNVERWALVRRVEKWIETLMQRYKIPVPLRDDLRQHVYLWLFDRADRFDASKGAITTWAGWQFRGALRHFKIRHERVFGPSRGSLTSLKLQDDCDTRARWSPVTHGALVSNGLRAVLALENVDDDVASSVDDAPMQRRVAFAIDALPERERDVVVAIGQGQTLARTGAMLGISRERVRQIREVAFDRMRKRIALHHRHRTGCPSKISP